VSPADILNHTERFIFRD